jgi:hypothetical protein
MTMHNYVVSIAYHTRRNTTVLVSGMVRATSPENAITVGEAHVNDGYIIRAVTAIRADEEHTLWLADNKLA